MPSPVSSRRRSCVRDEALLTEDRRVEDLIFEVPAEGLQLTDLEVHGVPPGVGLDLPRFPRSNGSSDVIPPGLTRFKRGSAADADRLRQRATARNGDYGVKSSASATGSSHAYWPQ
jgi:hypothetical protein